MLKKASEVKDITVSAIQANYFSLDMVAQIINQRSKAGLFSVEIDRDRFNPNFEALLTQEGYKVRFLYEKNAYRISWD